MENVAFGMGVIASEVAGLNSSGDIPATIKVAPAGRVTTRDGRSYQFDPALLVSRFQADGIDLPVDLDHATSRRAAMGERADAVGWVKNLHAKADGIYAQVDWLEGGKAVLAARTHRYISPTFKHDPGGAATWLHSVALVTAPALSMPAVADASPAVPSQFMGQLAGALGLDQAMADESAVLAAVARLMAKHETAMSGLASTVTQLNAQRNEMRQSQVEMKVEDCLKQGVFPPAMREWALELCSTNEESFDHFVSKIGTPLAHLFAPAITPDMEARMHASRFGTEALSDAAASVGRVLGVNPDRLR
ncbi:phage protease [Xanthobacter sp. TB0139]|uniref:phage protease n=1 Tax=Xanthobacter sp. TB0139 TaxID=3459178 RepID=UPI004039DDBC